MVNPLVRRWFLPPGAAAALCCAAACLGALSIPAWSATTAAGGTPPHHPPAVVQAAAQAPVEGEAPAQRLASICGVALGEYAKGVDSHGHVVAADERDEATGFLTDARDVAERLPGDRRDTVTALIDTL